MLPGNLAGAIENASPPVGSIRAERISICHVVSGDLWAGAEAQLAMVLKGLAREKDFHLCAILLNEGRLAEQARHWGVEVKVIPEDRRSFLEIFKEATLYLRGKGVRILHSHRYKENLLAALLAWRCKIPLLVRSEQGLPEPYGSWKRYKHGLVHAVDRIVARYATDFVICASRDLRNQVVRYVNPRQVVTIYNAVDREQARSNLSVSEAKKRLGFPESCRLLGIAGRLEAIKRVDIFLSAATAIAARLPDTRFLIVGAGTQETRLRALVKTSGLQDRVVFLGHRSDIYDVLRALDILVVCSDHEGLPTIMLEGLCLGVPVVARAVGGIPEVIQDGVGGILVESADPSVLAEACLQLLSDDARRNLVVAAGSRLVTEKFTADHGAEEVAKLYRSLCGPKKHEDEKRKFQASVK